LKRCHPGLMRWTAAWIPVAAAGILGLCGPVPAAGAAGIPDHLPAVPHGNPNTVFSKDGPYKPGVAFQTTPGGDTLVITYPVDPAATVGKPHYVIDLLRWLNGSPTAPTPANLPKDLPTTLATDAYQDVPIATPGPFPVVMFSHGFSGYPEQSSFLTDHLATWGFVVVAPDHRSRDLHAMFSGTTGRGQSDITDLRQALAVVRFMNAAPNDLLSHKLDLTRVASLGHSSGGGAAIAFARGPDVRTYVALAPEVATPPRGKPGMLMQGTADQEVNPAGTKKLYASLSTPKRLVLLDRAGHNVFDDACSIGAAQGGLVAVIKKLGLPRGFVGMATDGCLAPDVSPPKVWPLIDQAVTAQLRWSLGIDRAPVGLGPGMGHAYPGVSASVTADP